MLTRWFDVLRLRTRSLFRRHQVERELLDELSFHRELNAETQTVGIAQIQEECRDMRRTRFIENLVQDLRYATRILAKNPGFTVVMVLTLALSIGATTAIFSLLEGVLLRTLPFRDPARLVRIFTSNPRWPKFPVNPLDFRDFRARVPAFESIAAYVHSDLQMSGSGDPIRLSGFSVTAGFFHVLGLEPAKGRAFDRNDELPAKGFVAILSDRVWRTKFGARRDIIGQKVLLNQLAYSIVGVMPPGVEHPGNMYHAVSYGDTVDIWVPFTFSPQMMNRGSHFLDVVARLRPGVTLAQANAAMNAAMHQLAREHPDNATGWSVLVIPLQREIVGRSRRLLLVLLGAAVLLLLLACVNAANLLLAKATSRQRELAVRAAVGAGRPRLIRQLLTESILLAFLGAALGTLLAVAGTKALVALLPPDFPRASDIHVDLPVFLFLLLITGAAALFFGIVPALNGSRQSLHEGSRSATASRDTLRLRHALVISEVTLACILLIAAGLMLRSFVNLLRTDPGFRPAQTLTATISLPEATYKDAAAASLFSRRLLSELRTVPGVTAAGLGSDLPWTGWDDNVGGFQIQGETPPPHDDFSARYHAATPGYFQALHIPLLRGRSFDEHDTAVARRVLIINQALAHAWQHGDPLGGRLTFEDHPKEKDWMTIVGIVGDIKDNPASPAAKAAFWWPLSQAWYVFGDLSVVIRSRLDPTLAANRLRAAVHRLDPALAVAEIRTMDRVADSSYSTTRFAFSLVALFAALALTLAAIGTYGVIAYSVNQRLPEFGIRMALGATPANLVRDILAGAMKLAGLGAALGLTLGILLSRLLGALLYEVTTNDPLTLATTCLLALSAAALACALPALRIARLDPTTALRTG